MTTEVPTGWKLLHSPLPKAAIKPLSEKVYGVGGLSDVNEAYLIQRLFASGLSWSWVIKRQEFLTAEDRPVQGKDYTLRYYLASVQGRLTIDGQIFDGSGGSDNRKLDAAFKGASTVAFKNACKMAGMTAELYLDGRAMDFIYEFRDTEAGSGQRPSGSPNGPTTASSVAVGQPAPAQSAEVSPGVTTPGADERSGDAPTPAPAATTPPPPSTEPAKHTGRGPAAKRGNVVTVEQAPTAPTTAPVAVLTNEAGQVGLMPIAQPPPGASETLKRAAGLSVEEQARVDTLKNLAENAQTLNSDAPTGLTDDDGNSQAAREALRARAAVLYRLQIIYKNQVTNAARSDLWEAVPIHTPNPGSDTALNNLIGTTIAGATLADLEEGDLAKMGEIIEPFIAKRLQQLAAKGISIE